MRIKDELTWSKTVGTRVEVRTHEWILNEAVDARGASNDKIERDIDQVMQ